MYYKEIIQTADSKSGNLDYNIYVKARLVIHIHSHLPIAENNEHRVTCLLRVKSDAIANVYLYLHCSYIQIWFLLFIIHGKALSLNSGITWILQATKIILCIRFTNKLRLNNLGHIHTPTYPLLSITNIESLVLTILMMLLLYICAYAMVTYWCIFFSSYNVEYELNSSEMTAVSQAPKCPYLA